MNWKNEAIEKLRRYSSMQLASHNLPEEISMLEEAFTSIRSAKMDATPSRGGGNKREDMLLNNIVKRQELTAALEHTQKWLSSTDRALRGLSKEEQKILQRMFIYPEVGSVQRLCQELGVEQSSVYRKRDKALERFTRALYGVTETS